MSDRIRRLFSGGSNNEVIVQALHPNDSRVDDRSDGTRFYLVFNARGFEKINVAVNVVDNKRVQIVATRREQVDSDDGRRTVIDETVFYEHTLPADVDPRSLKASWLSSKLKLTIEGDRRGVGNKKK